MIKEELEKEAREYLAEHSKYSEVFGETFVAVDTLTAMVEFAEPREKRIAELKCECRRCVYTDSPCILSDYGKDKNGICDHFKDVFDENAELKEELEQVKKAKVVEHFEAYGQCRDSRRIAELEAQIEKMKCCENCAFQLVIGGVRDRHCVKCNACSEWELEG